MNDIVWRKASRSSNNGGDCVELARIDRGIAIRDSKDPGGPWVVLASGSFRRLARRLKDG